MPRPRAAPPLAGWYVISLRPPDGHAGVRRAAAALGARVFALSPLRLEPLPAAAALARALACPRVVATSPAAVRFAFANGVPAAALGKQWFAPGEGTGAALRRRGIARVMTPGEAGDADALLALPALRALAGTRIGLLSAPGGRDVLAPAFVARGATVARADVYRRVVRAPAPHRLAAAAALPARTALLASSAEALAALWDALDADGRRALARRPAVASSARLAARLHALGFAQVVVAEGARPAQLLAALARAAGSRRVRLK
jgi:uroporphyrinogen-III synthase